MSIFITDRVDFLLGELSRYGVSQETGIPSSTLYKYAEGIGGIPDIYRSGVRNAYERINYLDLRESGFSSFQARRFRTLNPESSDIIKDQFHETIQELSRGYSVKRIEALGLDPTEENISRFMSAGSRKIREGMRNSKLPYEDWVDYAKK